MKDILSTAHRIVHDEFACSNVLLAFDYKLPSCALGEVLHLTDDGTVEAAVEGILEGHPAEKLAAARKPPTAIAQSLTVTSSSVSG